MAIWEIALNRSRREIKKSLLVRVGSFFLPQNGEGAVSGRNNLDTYQMPPPPPLSFHFELFLLHPFFSRKKKKRKGDKKVSRWQNTKKEAGENETGGGEKGKRGFSSSPFVLSHSSPHAT